MYNMTPILNHIPIDNYQRTFINADINKTGHNMKKMKNSQNKTPL